MGSLQRGLKWWPTFVFLGLLCQPVRAQAPRDWIALDEIEGGQTGYGLSVFAGSEPERFELEVLGVLENTSPDRSYILARLTGQNLESHGVISGMSGSPVFIDDRLAGAVSFSWSFTKEAIAGIMPIGAMRELSQLPAGGVPATPVSSVVELRQLLAGELPRELLERPFQRLRTSRPDGTQTQLLWNTVGFDGVTEDLLRRNLGALAPAGKTNDLDVEFGPGSAVAGILMDGDLQVAATGTITDRHGDEVLAFGHSLFGMGPVRLPMALAEVITVVSNQASSFKVTNLGPVVGAFDEDRYAGMRGRMGLDAPTLPVTLKLRGLASRDFHLQVADLPLLRPSLIASAVLQALDSVTYFSGPQGIDVVARFEIEKHGELTIRETFDGEDVGFPTAIFLLSLINYIESNPLERLNLLALDVELQQVAKPRTANLLNVHAGRTEVRPEDRLPLYLELQAYRGETYRRSIEIEIPAEVPPGSYYLFVGDGSSVDAARTQIEPSEPVNFAQALEVLRSFHSRRDLVVLGYHSGRGLVIDGTPLPELPGSVRSFWSAAARPKPKSLRFSIAQEEVQPMETPIQGLVRIDLKVLRPEPVSQNSRAPSDRLAATENRGPANSNVEGRR